MRYSINTARLGSFYISYFVGVLAVGSNDSKNYISLVASAKLSEHVLMIYQSRALKKQQTPTNTHNLSPPSLNPPGFPPSLMPAQRPTKEEKRVNPPRPPNPWILYRQDKWKEFKRTDCKYSQSEISRFIAAAWAKEQPHVKAEYERRAAQAKAEHHIRYPHYVYKPQQKRKDKKDDSAAGSQPKAKRVSSTGSTAIEPIPIANPLYPVDPCEMMMVAAKYGEMGPSPPMSLACSPDTIFGPSGSSSQAAASQATLAAAIAQQLARISSLPVEPADAPVVSEQTLTPATPVTASLWNVSDYHDPQQTIEQDLGWMTALTGEVCPSSSSWSLICLLIYLPSSGIRVHVIAR